MSIIKNIRTSFGKFFYRKKLANTSRNIKLINMTQVRSAAIIFDANNANNLKHVKELVKHIPVDAGISVMGYIDGKKENFSYIGDNVYSFVAEADFDFFMRPKPGIIPGFIEKQFDVLFVLHNKYLFEVDMLTGLSNARLKVGQSGDYAKNLDFIIETKDNNTSYLISQILHYMNNITTTNVV